MNKHLTEPAELEAGAAASAALPHTTPPERPPHPRRIIIFLFLLMGVFMATLDNQIVATALPTIVGEFGQIERFGWVASAYLLASSAVMPVYGKLGDLFGRKYVMLAAIAIFTIGSLTCALAVSMNTLIAARVLQALGGGGIMVTIFSINADLFAPRERARYQSYSSLVLMLSGAIGPVLGGTMSDLFGWRSIFFINLPVGIIVLTALAIMLPYKRPDRKPKIDYPGAILAAMVTGSIVLWADGSELFGGLLSPAALAVLGTGMLALVALILVERRAPEPVLPLSLFRNRQICLLLTISAASGAIGIGLVTYYALYLQSGLGLSPSAAGVFFIPLTAGIAIGSLSAGRLMSASGNYKIFSVLSTLTGVIMLLAYSFTGSNTPTILLGLIMLAQGIGVGIGQQVPVLGVQNAADKRDVGAATGSVTLTRIGGASIGISIYGAILSAGLGRHMGEVPGVEHLEKLSPAQTAALPETARHLLGSIYQSAFHPLFLTAALIAAVGLVAALALRNIRLPVGDAKG